MPQEQKAFIDDPKMLTPFFLEENGMAEPPDYSEEELKYMGRWKQRLVRTKNNRDREHFELDGMTFLEWYQNNEKLANTFVGRKSNRSDVNYQSGTIRQKLWTFLAAINKMNLQASVMAFDDQETMLNDLGLALSTILRKTEELDNDEEKRLIRIYEMLKQGTVFVQEQWKKQFRVRKSLNKKFSGQVKGLQWQKQLQEYLSCPSRDVLWSPGVYLGSMKTYFMKDQPFAFTVDIQPYETVASQFQNWERFKNVPRKLITQMSAIGATNAAPFWSINDNIQNDQVEIIRYEDPWNDEFMLSLNGVMMLPVGFPLSEITPDGEFSFTSQQFEMIHAKFPYGKSLPMKLRNKVAVLDEAIKMGVLKNQQSFAPTMVNRTGRHLSSSIFFPGKILHGIDPEKLTILNEKFAQGVTQGEMAMMEFFQGQVDDDSVNKTFQGASNTTKTDTATEVLTIQEQSSMIVGQAIFTSAMLEKKLADLRIPNLIKNWFNPIDTKMDEIRGIVDKFRTVNIEGQVPGKGNGRLIVVPTEAPPTPEQIYSEEQSSSYPMRKIYIVPSLLKVFKYTFQTIVNPTDKRSGTTGKLLFRAMMADAVAYFDQDLNVEYLEERFAETWQEDPSKMFMKKAQTPAAPTSAAAGQPDQGGMGMNNTVKPAGMMNNASGGNAGAPTPPNLNLNKK